MGKKGNRERNYAYIDILVDFSVNRNKIIETSHVFKFKLCTWRLVQRELHVESFVKTMLIC